MTFEESDWYNLYKDRWNGILVGEAMSHPAKFSRAMIRKIYEHCIEEGWLGEGSLVIDPFAGVALGALDAMSFGLDWVGVEIEERFVKMGQDNINTWNNQHKGTMSKWGHARLIQGDSRYLLGVLRNADISVSSPPYSDIEVAKPDIKMSDIQTRKDLREGDKWEGYNRTNPDNLGNLPADQDGFRAAIASPPYQTETQGGGLNVNKPETFRGVLKDGSLSMGNSEGNLSAMPDSGLDLALSSPPYAEARIGQESGQEQCGHNDAYGESDGQLGSFKDQGFDASISSPPFRGQSADGGWQMLGRYAEEGRLNIEQVKGDPTKSYPSWNAERDTSYGHSEGQLADMQEGDFDSSISSPPFLAQSGGTNVTSTEGPLSDPALLARHSAGNAATHGYGETEGQLGSREEDSFWIAARKVVDQVYAVLKPGGHAVWVTKRYVKDKKIVDFSQQWAQLCEAAGFRVIHRHRAWLIEDRGTQFDLFGKEQRNVVKRYSFFRRLHAEHYPELEIQWEDVICMEK